MFDRTVMISGGFDPIHLGHLELIKEARALAGTGRVFAIVDSDVYVSSKHKLMFPQEERVALVASLSEVDTTLFGETADGNCTSILMRYPPEIYLVGPDHSDHKQLLEYSYCEAAHIEIMTATRPRAKNWHSSDYAQPKWKNPVVTISALLTNSMEELLITTRGLEPSRGDLEVPGGFLEINESLEDGVRREVKEEIGVEIANLRYFTSVKGKYSDGREIISVYFSGRIQGTPNLSEECLSIDYYSRIPSVPSFFNQADYQAVVQFFNRGAL